MVPQATGAQVASSQNPKPRKLEARGLKLDGQVDRGESGKARSDRGVQQESNDSTTGNSRGQHGSTHGVPAGDKVHELRKPSEAHNQGQPIGNSQKTTQVPHNSQNNHSRSQVEEDLLEGRSHGYPPPIRSRTVHEGHSSGFIETSKLLEFRKEIDQLQKENAGLQKYRDQLLDNDKQWRSDYGSTRKMALQMLYTIDPQETNCHPNGQPLHTIHILRKCQNKVDHLMDEWRDLAMREKTQSEVTERLKHDLKIVHDGMLSSVDRFQPITDTSLAEKYNVLNLEIKGLSRKPWAIKENELVEMLGFSSVGNLPKKHYKTLLERDIWTKICQAIFSSPYAVFGEVAVDINDMWLRMFGDSDYRDSSESRWPKPSPRCEKYRYVTFEELRAQLGSTEPGARAGALIDSHKKAKQGLFRELHELLSPISSSDKTQDINSVVEKAIELAFEIGHQRCRLQLRHLRSGVVLKRPLLSEEVKDVNEENEEDYAGGTIEDLLEVAPGIIKFGDGHGENLETQKNIVPVSIYSL